MKNHFDKNRRWATAAVILLLVLIGVGDKSLGSASEATLDPLDDILIRLAEYDYGKDSTAVHDLATLMGGRQNCAALNAEIEKRFIIFLQSDASIAAKQCLCEQLSFIGTPASVEVLAKMLVEPSTAEITRYALERIPGVEADAALRAALSKTGGRIKVGIVNSLGVRGDAESIADLEALLNSDDLILASAAAGALGRIADSRSLEVLLDAVEATGGEVKHAVCDACLNCAEQLECRAPDAALRVYQRFWGKAYGRQFRIGALTGLVRMGGEKGGSVLPEALEDADANVQRTAAELLRDADESVVSRAAERLKLYPVNIQVQILNVLADRRSTNVLPIVLDVYSSESAEVRSAALKAVGDLGSADQVMFLAECAANRDGLDRQAAQSSLYRLQGENVDQVILSAIEQAAPEIQSELIRSTARRYLPEATPILLKAAGGPDQQVAIESLKALDVLAGPEHLSPLIDVALADRDRVVEREAIKTVVTVARLVSPAEAQSDAVLARYVSASSVKNRCLLLRILGQLSCERSLDVLYSALSDSNSQVRDSAIRALSEWKTATPADRLMAIVDGGEELKVRILALRGCIRLAGIEDEDPEQSLAIYRKAMSRAERLEEKRLIIAGLSSLASPGALAMVGERVSDASLKAEATAAVIHISEQIDEIHPTEVKIALDRLMKMTDDPVAKAKATELLNFGYITQWLASGPYTEPGKSGSSLLDVAFGPEQFGQENVIWKTLSGRSDASQFWLVDLNKAIGGDNEVVYLRTELFASEETRFYLVFGSSGHVKIWINGDLYEKVHDTTPCRPGEHSYRFQVKKGWNELMVKITHDQGAFGFCCRLRQEDGGAVGKVQAKLPEK